MTSSPFDRSDFIIIKKLFIRPIDSRLRFFWKFGLIIILGQILANIIGALLGYFLVSYFSYVRKEIVDINALQNNPVVIGICMIIGQVILLFLVLFFIKKIDKREFKETGVMFNKKSITHFLLGCIIAIISIFSAILIYYILGCAGYKLVKGIEFNSINDINLFSWLVFGFILFLLVGFQEELLCRGYMITDLSGLKPYWAILLPAVIFASMHLTNPQFSFEGGTRTTNTIIALINIFIIGIILGTYFYVSRNLWPVIGFHFIWNFVQGSILGLNVSGFEMGGLMSITLSIKKSSAIFTGGPIGPEGSVVVLGANIITALLFLMLVLLKTKKKRESFIEPS